MGSVLRLNLIGAFEDLTFKVLALEDDILVLLMIAIKAIVLFIQRNPC